MHFKISIPLLSFSLRPTDRCAIKEETIALSRDWVNNLNNIPVILASFIMFDYP